MMCAQLLSALAGWLMQLKAATSHQRDVVCLKSLKSASAHACP